ncbi:hypothetical protein [Sulfurimonas sp.]
MKNLFFIFVVFFISFIFIGCQESKYQKPYVMDDATRIGVNPNSLAYIAEDKAADRKNQLALKKLETDAKVTIMKINSQKDLDIAKLDAQTKKEIAHANVTVKKEVSQRNFYIALALIIILLLALFLWYFNNRKNRELQAKLEEQRLNNSLMIKARELEHERANKLLELLGSGKLSTELETEIIATISTQKRQNCIQHK